MLGDLLAERLALLAVRDAQLEGASGQPARAGRDVDPAHLDAVHHLVEALAGDAAEHLRVRRAVSVEDELGRVDALVAHLLDLAGHRDALRRLAEPDLLVDEEGRHVLVGALALTEVGTDEHGDEVGRAPVGQPHLLAGDDPLLAVAHRLGPDRRDVGAQPRLRHRERPAHLTGRHPGQVALLLLVGPVLEDEVGDDEVGVDDAAHRHPAPRDLLDDERVRQQRLPEPAVLLGDHQPEDPHLLHALDDLRRVLVAVLELGRDRQDLLLDELPDERDELLLLLGEAVRGLQSGHA